MWRNSRLHIGLFILVALAAFFFIRQHSARGATPGANGISEGHRLAKAWCASCHAVEPHMAGMPGDPPSFEAIANHPGITPLALKVFFRTSHKDMPNLVIPPDQADVLASYILSLKTN
ncbi:c-type cytochrome [Bradyrhizobium sp.]|jgi:cytochrome c|uniref:c-type cytochrome n=1 Tax=Bradyrhizobium sp. TaxID=376 RepID=UPI003C413FCB